MSKNIVYRGKKGSKTSTWSSKRVQKKKAPPNRYEAERKSEGVSASAKKLRQSTEMCDVPIDNTFGYRLVNFATLMSAISAYVVCKVCGSEVKFYETSKRGLGFKVVISCSQCESKDIPASPFIRNGYEINRRFTFVMRLLGIGLHGMKKFCGFMDMPAPIFHSFYDSIVDTISIATKSVAEVSMRKAAKEEKEKSIEKGQLQGITVSGDGSWRKRGFSSLYGMVSLIGLHTGKVIDIIVKSKYCKSCEYWKSNTDTAEYEEWQEAHAESCQSNHLGSSGKMEVDGVIEMFQRSVESRDVKYAYYIGDGDSKTFKGIMDANPYEGLIVKKKECIAHVQKRMGTRLRNLKKTTKSLGGKGKLTGKLIDDLTMYYGLSIRRNTHSLEEMRKEIWATLYHKLSTDEKPQHDNCPSGVDSWCSWQKAKAENALNAYKHKSALSTEVFDAITPIYEDLSRDDLLERCLGGFTQNNNECFNSTVWNFAPKSTSSNKKVLDIATDMAVCIFNDGMFSIMKIMKVLELQIGLHCYNFCTEADARRVEQAESSLSDVVKKSRLACRAAKKMDDDANADLDGVWYGAGIAM